MFFRLLLPSNPKILVIFAIVVLGLEGPMFLNKDHWVG